MARQFPIQTEDSQCCYWKRCGDLGQTGAIATWSRGSWKFPCNNTLAIGLKVYSAPVLGENPDTFEKHDRDRKTSNLKNTVQWNARLPVHELGKGQVALMDAMKAYRGNNKPWKSNFAWDKGTLPTTISNI